MKKVLILGSTGSIGRQTLEVIRQNKKHFQVVGLVCRSNIDLLKEQIKEFCPSYVGVYDKKNNLREKNIKSFYGEKEILKLIKLINCDIVVIAISGAAGLKPALTAIKSNKNIALATKEVMVLAGKLIKKELKKRPKVKLFPIDSEHSAIWQSLRAGNKKEVEKIILTCSGGPFLRKKPKDLETVNFKQALNHPNWKMGNKITIDSATLMNKGLELIEAKWLFDIPVEKIEIVVHPQSILHSAVLFQDGSIIGQFGLPDMKVPIQYALSYPKRLKNNLPRVSFTELKSLSFEKPDLKTFTCLRLAYDAIKIGGTMPTVLNAADEVAVELFLKEKIKFLDIPKIIFQAMNKHKTIKNPGLSEILLVDKLTRKMIYENYQ
ncbi:1-deoxy-D-xylulose-5-phosphate reductoisomerase [Candidatus Roizmanbacteria bacterium CG22_combo_CG10-13_8_21_14_all_35_9]|uniref:1-deoxy-D-xylulose 5-phosphate reductoisomerase n=4 Tax=Candidatus Roizmaniibacteriota TaxID=1752723 RepID=A0A2M8F487_9BACT|nr:MAG: 1-deoxy-D-xylulose-5-phosphate reductoisomerase [Candidatus Roizmanbacteria bacterium CG23_combo_of_CG06-09_8_20_14_all_35_49]PIP62694.1 MAG: 1-deoxy-D-xylulose-5-phosphate reductoisomerase [Candidatus Roizmanbacteria bacterium CG22_combo_CG10-13_8_21_14_all_35_9]PIY71097.1 MAG: 1-deoxy-D-xylulose-5-phosphate reductoisomerase [Candidatus Roizmanbacteria bacterium CG_4_10_14_0_8_um_filter_35_28]PJC34099.1 MAG: 1-deoxy-D-xylulose-5-phosphate reductoisomerase [Candidatus Roizmanbacteria bac